MLSTLLNQIEPYIKAWVIAQATISVLGIAAFTVMWIKINKH
ncbi:hypothetical protein [Clostridium botulinum]|nr:hypothetical protein [Clostridium botulinum]